jgi:hypothetical protein
MAVTAELNLTYDPMGNSHKNLLLRNHCQLQPNCFRGEDLKKNFIPLFSIFSLVAILVESRDHRTQFWKGAIQGSFHQSLVANSHKNLLV